MVGSAAAKAKACLAKAAPIPGSTLYHMGAAALGSKSDLDLLQHAIDYLTCKAQAKMTFSADEKDFLVNIFEDLWWGGQFKRYTEAAALADHYVKGKGAPLQIDADVYSTSVIVKDTSAAMKDYIRHLIAKRSHIGVINSSDIGFRHSAQYKHVSRAAGRNVNKQGYVLADGNLLTEQDNSRLKNANNRFILVAKNILMSPRLVSTRWRVDDRYVFESFERASFVTNIPLGSSALHLPDGLSHYMCILKIADEFDYWAEWSETWSD